MGWEIDLPAVRCRKNMLSAHRRPAVFAPAAIVAGLALWMTAIVGHGQAFGLELAVLLALAALGLLVVGLALPTVGSWMTLDRKRGWIHWAHHGLRVHQQESFSPQRIDRIRLRRRGWPPPWPGFWSVNLAIDHPRLSCVRLFKTYRLNRAHRFARELSGQLNVNWIDEQGLLHVGADRHSARSRPAQPSRHNMEWFNHLPPPPEIHVARRGDRASSFVLPNPIGYHDGNGWFLLYAILWCLWAWSSFAIECQSFGPMARWDAQQTWIAALLFGASLAGLAMLATALFQVHARQSLRASAGRWMLGRRCLGRDWLLKPLRWQPDGWIRRIDPPGPEIGLWLPLRDRELRLGSGLTAEGLVWLQELILRHNDPSPHPASPGSELAANSES